MKKLFNNKNNAILIFLALFGFSIGLFDNYRELWMSSNNMDSVTISHIISVSYIVTVLVLFYFTIRVSTQKLKNGIVISLIIKLITSTILICLNGTNNLFFIKLLMFFDIAFSQVIISSVYPLMMSIAKNDIIYTKKEVVTNIASKLGFLLVSIILGKTIFGTVIDYNICLLLSTILVFLSFLILSNLELNSENKKDYIDLSEAINYFNKNKVLILYLITCLVGGVIWSSVIGMPMLTLTKNIGFKPSEASFFILSMGILSNVLSILVLKYFRHKNDHINLIFKFGLRLTLYLLVIIFNSKTILIIAFIYLLITDAMYSFIFDSHFINSVKEEYSLLITVLKYCASLIGNSIGVFICGLLFNLDIQYLTIPALIIGIIHYIMCTILINKKNYNRLRL